MRKKPFTAKQFLVRLEHLQRQFWINSNRENGDQ